MDLVHFICELEKKNPWVKWIFFFLERIKGTHEFEYCNKSLSSLNFGTNNVLWWRLHTQSSLWCFISVTQLDSTFLDLKRTLYHKADLTTKQHPLATSEVRFAINTADVSPSLLLCEKGSPARSHYQTNTTDADTSDSLGRTLQLTPWLHPDHNSRWWVCFSLFDFHPPYYTQMFRQTHGLVFQREGHISSKKLVAVHLHSSEIRG